MKTPIQAIIADDEPLAREYLKVLLESEGAEVIQECENAAEVLTSEALERADVVFLDIQMPGITGIEVANVLGKLRTPPLIVFVTAFSEHAVQAFEQNATDYVLKPISQQRLRDSLQRVQDRLHSRTKAKEIPGPARDKLAVSDRSVVRYIAFDRILFAITQGKTVVLHTLDGEVRCGYSLRQLQELLPPRFLRVHGCCLVDSRRVSELTTMGQFAFGLRLSNGVELPVSRRLFPRVKKLLGAGLPP